MKTISLILFLLVTAQAQAWVEIISCVVESPQPTAAVEQVKSTTPEQASVRVVVDHGLLKSRCSGTAIEGKKVITCWHAFRDRGSVEVNGKPAKLIRFDAVSDVALIETSEQLPSVPVASKPATKGESVIAYGYEYTRQGLWKFPTKITAINRYSGFSNQSILGRPAQGRSGGGLFNEQGELIGVCSASDGNEGLYCGLEAVQKIITMPKSAPADSESLSLAQGRLIERELGAMGSDCPDGRCPLQRKQPTLAPQAIEPAPARPVLRSVMQPVQRVVQAQPVRRMAGRLFSGRLLRGFRCR
jgi:hypothetical protein